MESLVKAHAGWFAIVENPPPTSKLRDEALKEPRAQLDLCLRFCRDVLKRNPVT